MQTPEPISHLSRGQFRKMKDFEVDSDPRGILWIWQHPEPAARYVIGADASSGIAGWERELRTDHDEDIDNCAAEVIKIGEHGSPDELVAEFAAPIDAEEFAVVLNTMGRYYGTSYESRQALLAPEVWPGPGGVTLSRLMNEFDYTNIFAWRDLRPSASAPQLTRKLGWYTDQFSRPHLLIRGMRHIQQGGFKIASPWLVEEMGDAEHDHVKQTIRAAEGSHDDRLIAAFIGLWVANDWSTDYDETAYREKTRDPDAPKRSWQSSPISARKMSEELETQFAKMLDGYQ